jgi:UDP-2,3-diacylglucosamine pyrophosphatase LpxH
MPSTGKTLEDMVRAMFDQPYYRRPSPVTVAPEAHCAPTGGSYIRLIIPDSHGEHIDWGAADGMLLDIESLSPDIKETVWLGDHLDCGGTFNAHQRNYSHEMTESYQADVLAARRLVNMVRERTPFATHDYLEGNHEAHVERFLARNFGRFEDAEFLLDLIGPRAVLNLDALDIRYHRSSEMHDGLSVPGLIKRGRCHFIHGVSVAKNAVAATLERIGDNVVHGHTHRAQSTIQRTATSSALGGWCPGTLAKLQPLYRHTSPTNWTHGYALQFIEPGGKFTHMNVPLFGQKRSGLRPLLKMLGA